MLDMVAFSHTRFLLNQATSPSSQLPLVTRVRASRESYALTRVQRHRRVPGPVLPDRSEDPGGEGQEAQGPGSGQGKDIFGASPRLRFEKTMNKIHYISIINTYFRVCAGLQPSPVFSGWFRLKPVNIKMVASRVKWTTGLFCGVGPLILV